LFLADAEEEIENLEKLGVDEITQMLNAYRDIVNSPDYIDLERKREMNRLDEGQALYHAAKVAKEEAAAEWQGIVADKDAEILIRALIVGMSNLKTRKNIIFILKKYI